MDSFIFGAIVAVIITSALPMISFLLPVPRTPDVMRSFAELRKDYRKRELYVFVTFLPIASTTGYGWWKVLCNLVGSNGLSMNSENYSISAGTVIWAVPAMVLGILTASLAIDIIYKSLLKEIKGARLELF